MNVKRKLSGPTLLSLFLGLFLCALWSQTADAHGMSEADKLAIVEGGNLRYLWLGATHMLSGYDHLLFVFGIIFFLNSFRDIAKYITAFTLGHSVTLILATFNAIQIDYFLIDAVIGLSVSYIAFHNIDGFRKYLGVDPPNMLFMIIGLGLIHGLGLSTRLQQLPLSEDGLLLNIISFNVGVELGQVSALALMLLAVAAWRKRPRFDTFSRIANYGLILAGGLLFLMQLHGYEHASGAEESVVSEELAGTPREGPWKDSIDITIPARGDKEYKFHLRNGATLEYTWSTGGASLFFDFHGEPAGEKAGSFKSFKKGTDSQSHGSLTASFEGTHGWYWKNSNPFPVVVALKVDGDYQRQDQGKPRKPRDARGKHDETRTEGFSKLPFHAAGPVAKVNGTEVSAAMFNEEVRRLVRMVPALPPGQSEEYKARVLENVISKVLIEQAVAEAKIDVSQADVDAEFDVVREGLDTQGRGGMAAMYRRSGTNEANFKRELADTLRFEILVSQKTQLEIEDGAEEFRAATRKVLDALRASATIETFLDTIKTNPNAPAPAPEPSFGGHGHAH